MPGDALSKGQVIALMTLSAGGAGLLALLLARIAGPRHASPRTAGPAALVGVLLIGAAVALLLVRRLDPAALSRVLAGATAEVPAGRPHRVPLAAARAHHPTYGPAVAVAATAPISTKPSQPPEGPQT